MLVCASGVDYYPPALGVHGFDDDEVTEVDAPGDEFLARLCASWEAEARAAIARGVRVCSMRTGLVFGGDGGALARMKQPFAWFVGGRIGSGRQLVSWIHRDDVIAAYANAIEDDRYVGPINLVAGSVRNAELARAIGHAMHRPAIVPVPAFALRLAVGAARRVDPPRPQCRADQAARAGLSLRASGSCRCTRVFVRTRRR